MKKILKTEMLSGNKAVGKAVELSRVQGIFAYPITPQTTIVEDLSERVARGKLNAAYIPVDSEAAAMAATLGAEKAGIRAFTATSSQGLYHMMEPLSWAAYGRCSLVMVNVDRAICHPWGLWSDTNASMGLKDQGLLTFYCEDAQDILNTIIIAYRLSETLYIPTMVSYDGFRCSHAYEGILTPSQEMIDKFLPPFKSALTLDPKNPFSYGNLAMPDHYAQMRFQHHRDMMKAIELAEKYALDYKRITGLKTNMVLETVNTNQAETIFITSGSKVGPIREVVESDPSIGLIKVKMFCPWPTSEILKHTRKAKRIVVIDDNLAPGRGGSIWREIRSSFYGNTSIPILGYVYGLNGQDFKPEIINKIHDDAKIQKYDNDPILWGESIELKEKKKITKTKKYNKTELAPTMHLSPGHTGCAGCGATLAMKMAQEALGEDVAMVIPACCWTILQGANGQSTLPHRPIMHTAFGLAAPTAAGMKSAYEMRGKDTTVVVWGGDGSTYDIGFGAVSGAAERNDNILYICYNNQAYMNTGVQRSSATLKGSITTTTPFGATKEQNPKNVPLIMKEHGAQYVATATPAYFNDLKKKITKAKEMKGFRYIEILIPCPAGWKFSSEMTVAISRLAVQTGIYPLYEIENGVLTKLQPGNPEKVKSVEEYFKTQKRFASLKQEDFRAYDEQIQKYLQKLIAMK